MDKMKFETPDLVQGNIEKIEALFPNCVTETRGEDGKLKKAVNFELLRQMLSGDVLEGDEAYEFTWVGKKAAIVEANKPIRKTLRPCPEESVDWDTTENLYIEGDNLEVLKLLQESYLGKVKMIYIDPPYNTGNDFIYRDDFAMKSDEYEQQLGMFNEESGERLFKNTDTNGRFHSDWCSMIFSRLMLARNLLTADGVIFISIDENEASTLKSICDEVFGPSNFIAELIWSAGRKNDSKYISVSHEYILCYFKDIKHIQDHNIVWRERKQGLSDIYSEFEKLKKEFGTDYEHMEGALKKWYKSLPNGHPAKDHAHYNKIDDNGIFFASDISWPGGGGPKYDIIHPITHRPVKMPSRGWITNQETLKEWIKQGKVNFGKDETSVPTIKSYLADHEYGVPYSVFYQDGRAASKRLAVLMGNKVFENPKDEEIIERLIEFCGTDDGDIVLDFFSGSATTAHATFLANIRQNKNRNFIMVQLPEEIVPEKASAGASRKVAENAIALLDGLGVRHTVSEIGKERIRRAGKIIADENRAMKNLISLETEEDISLFTDIAKHGSDAIARAAKMFPRSDCSNPNLDTGFRVFKLDDSNMTDVYYSADEYDQGMLKDMESNVKSDRTDLDLLFGCLLEWGLPLSLPYKSETIEGCTVHTYNDGDLIACFDENVPDSVIKAIARRQPLRAVFRDSSFASSPAKINVEEIFKMLAPDTRVKVI